MATAYAAFTSLMHLISDLHEHPYPPIRIDEEHFDSLNSKISFFQKFLEDHHTSVDLKLELRIADAAYAAEDVIETQIAEKYLDQESFSASLQKAIEALDLIKNEVMKTKWNTERRSQGSKRSIGRPAGNSSENIVVGIEGLTLGIVDKLTLQQNTSGRRIISITGMGGIGKTTLARKVYEHKCITDYFDVRAWATISKDYNIHETLIELVHCLHKTDKESFRRLKEQELGLKLHQYLCGRRYLLIVDDLWDVEAWDSLRSFFPNSRGSGIVITTRQSKFASISSHTFAVDLLDKRKTWDLFCKTVFRRGDCPRELEVVGKEISDKCRGLPLSAVVIGGHLAKSPRTREYWESIAENLSSIVNSEDDDHCMKILSLSYTHLPVHLKPCFLYMGIFPEDQAIDVGELIRLWVAEGFLKPIHGKSLEEAAQDYISELVGRNLILVSDSSQRGEIFRCKIHDLLRDLCLKEALEKKFLCVVRKKEVPNNERRIVLFSSSSEVDHCYSDTIDLKLPSVIRTLILVDTLLPSIVHKSLRVLASAWRLDNILNDIVELSFQLVNLRCLDILSSERNILFVFPSSICSIWNLQSLYIGCETAKLPNEIWKMSQLRHVRISREFTISNPPPSESQSDHNILKNLQSARWILNFSFSEGLVKRIPNVRSLAVRYADARAKFSQGAYALGNIARLEKLESLTFLLDYVGSLTRRNEMLSSVTFPHSLKDLTVRGLRLDDVATKIGSLPLLEELRLEECSGGKWELLERQFVRLKYLQLYLCRGIECFTADSIHLPCLEELELSYMDSLKEISSDIGDIQMLKFIKLYQCPDSAVLCAKEIADYQKHQMGNEELHIKVTLLPRSSSLSAESLTASNFRAEYLYFPHQKEGRCFIISLLR